MAAILDSSARVTVTAFAKLDDALAALALAEAKQFLWECGCPEDRIEVEVRKLLRK